MFRRFARLAVMPTALAALFVAAPDLPFAPEVKSSEPPPAELPSATAGTSTSEAAPSTVPSDTAEPATSTPPPEADESDAADGPGQRSEPSAVSEASEPAGSASPRTTPPSAEEQSEASACPSGGIPIDGSGSGAAREDCETAAGAPSSGQRPLLSWPGVALVVTVGLLIFALGLGTTTRGRP